jgi:Biotin/lipoate A/B protein ligase family
MPLETKSRLRTPFARGLDLPPPFRLVTLREVGDAFAHAAAVAAEDGAGTLVHVGRFDLAEFAVVLEPDEPLRTARRAIYTGICALGDALAANAPPEKPISFDWPDAIRVDGGLVGGARSGDRRAAVGHSPRPGCSPAAGTKAAIQICGISGTSRWQLSCDVTLFASAHGRGSHTFVCLQHPAGLKVAMTYPVRHDAQKSGGVGLAYETGDR